MKKILLAHPTGNSNVRAIAESFLNNGNLYEFHTSIASFPENIWYKLENFNSEFGRRRFKSTLKNKTQLHPFKELGRVASQKFRINELTKAETGFFSIDQVYNYLDQQVARRIRKEHENIDAVYAYEDCALESFKVAKEFGITCIYDLPIAYWETSRLILEEEANRLPNWAQTLGGGINDSCAKLKRKENELKLADVVVGPGAFVLDSIPSWAKNVKTIESPFGSPNLTDSIKNTKNLSKALRVLFVGSMGQRKGLADLFEAMKLVRGFNIELVVLGGLLAPLSFYKKEYPHFTYESTRPQDGVFELMRSCDVFCLPSLVEGRALVIQEAMSQGLPILITKNTGADDLVIEEETGFLVPIRSPQSIAEKLKWFEANRLKTFEMGKNAQKLAKKYTWENYGNKIILDLLKIL